MDNLSGHVLVCGYGHVGRAVVKALVAGGQPVVVIDVGQDNVDAARQEGALAILGDADEDEILQQAGVTRATALVATVGSDAQNLYIAFAARRCNDHLRLVARAADPESKLNLEAAGLFDEISTPYESAGRELAGFALAGSTRLTV